MKSCTASSGFAPSTCVHFFERAKMRVAACLYNVHQTPKRLSILHRTAPARMRGHRLLAYPTSSQPIRVREYWKCHPENDGNNLDSFQAT